MIKMVEEGQSNFIKNMMLHAWSNYEKYAWGSDHLRPCSKTSVNAHKGPLAFTLIDSLDTLFIMGLEPQFKKARDYVATMDVVAFLDQDVDISFFETTIRVLGGLVAAGDVSGDQIFIQKASKIAERLLIAFDTPTGLPSKKEIYMEDKGEGSDLVLSIRQLHQPENRSTHSSWLVWRIRQHGRDCNKRFRIFSAVSTNWRS